MLQQQTYYRHACTVDGCPWSGPWTHDEEAADMHYATHVVLAHPGVRP